MNSGTGALNFTSAGDLGQTPVYSNWIYKGTCDKGAIQLSFTTGGTSLGVFSLQTSCDFGGGEQAQQLTAATQPTVGNGAILVVDDLTGSTTGALDMSTVTSVTLRYVDIADPWIRVKWAKTSGSGTTVTGRHIVMGAK